VAEKADGGGAGAISFGTDGWRDVIADGFTFDRVASCAAAVAEYFKRKGLSDRGVVVGHDTRFLSAEFAREVACVLAGRGVKAYLVKEATPVPAVAHAIRHGRCAGGVMITASHNPPRYNGFKIKGAHGGSAPAGATREIEELLACVSPPPGGAAASYRDALEAGSIEPIDAAPPYLASLGNVVDMDALSRLGGKVVVDPMHGAARGYARRFLERLGVPVVEIRGEENPSFGGVNPEPIRRNMDALVRAVLDEGAAAGFSTDGDADRVGAVDETGAFVDSHRIFALLLQHLRERRGWSGSVVKTFSTTRMIDVLAGRYGLRLHVTPIGFKHITEIMLRENVLIGGEESGGIGVSRHIPDRDGILCTLLLAEVMAVTGKPLSVIVSELLRDVGPHCYARADLELPPGRKEELMRELADDPPRSVGGLAVEGREDLDGFKFALEGGAWVLFRASGTEPLVRVYAEAASEDDVSALVDAGRRLACGVEAAVRGG